MIEQNSQRMFRIFLYGGGSVLLMLDIFFLLRSSLTGNYVPIVPILAGIFTAAGLLFIVYAEQRARIEDRKNHRRISRVAHQLQNPLKHLQDNLGQLLKNADQLPAAERIKIKRMETSSDILLNNIRDVFLALQAQEGPITKDVRAYDMCKVLEEAYERSQTLASAKNVELIFKTHCKKAVVRLDRSLFLIAITHVIENAIYYTLKPGLVNIVLIKGKDRIRIIVQDRGVGIKGDDKEAVFTPFARGESAEKYEPDGIGIGLALTRLILRDLKGSITWRPKPKGAGTEFEIKLPLVKK